MLGVVRHSMLALTKQSLLMRVRFATILMWTCGVVAGWPLLYALFRLANVSSEPSGDDEYLAISFWFCSWGVFLILFALIGLSLALDRRRTLQDQKPTIEKGDAPRFNQTV